MVIWHSFQFGKNIYFQTQRLEPTLPLAHELFQPLPTLLVLVDLEESEPFLGGPQVSWSKTLIFIDGPTEAQASQCSPYSPGIQGPSQMEGLPSPFPALSTAFRSLFSHLQTSGLIHTVP